VTTRLLIVDDHAVVRSGLRMLLENEREIACDELATRLAAVEPGAYAETLLALAGGSDLAGASPALALLPRQPGQLELRIRALLAPALPRTGLGRLGEVGLTGLAFVFLAACSLSSSSQSLRTPLWSEAEIEQRLTASPFPGEP